MLNGDKLTKKHVTLYSGSHKCQDCITFTKM